MRADRAHTFAAMLACPIPVTETRREEVFNAMCADMFDLGAGRQTGFDRLEAMRRQLLEDEK